jgi:hypothetical protein
MVLDQNAKLKKEYQQMMLTSFVYAPKKVQITIKLNTISEYACTNRIQKFQPTLWAKVNPLFPNDYLWCLDGNLSIDWAPHLASEWQYTIEQFADYNEDGCQHLWPMPQRFTYDRTMCCMS